MSRATRDQMHWVARVLVLAVAAALLLGSSGAAGWLDDPALLQLAAEQGLAGECGFRTVDATTVPRPGILGGPVRIAGAATRWPALAQWRNQSVFREYLGTLLPRWPTGVRTMGLPVRSSPATVGSFIDEMQHPAAGMLLDYVETGQFGAGTAWMSSPPPPLLGPAAAEGERLMISIGATRQGYPFHNHLAAFETVVIGRKLVLSFSPSLQLPAELMDALTLAPPEQLLVPNSPLRSLLGNATAADGVSGSSGESLGSTLARVGIATCLLSPGDTVFLPCNTFHSTLNFGDTVAVGSMRTHGEDCADKDLHGADAAADAAARALSLERDALEAEESGDGPLLAAAVKAKREACALARFDVMCPVVLARLLRLQATDGEIAYAEQRHSPRSGEAARTTADLLEAAGARFKRVAERGLLPRMLLSVALSRYAEELLDLALALAAQPEPPAPALAAELQRRAQALLAASVESDPDGHNIKAQVSWAMVMYGQATQSQSATREVLRLLRKARAEIDGGGSFWYLMLDTAAVGGSRADVAVTLRHQIDQTVGLLEDRLGSAGQSYHREEL